MPVFPQLASGASTQYPLSRRRSRRVVRSESPAGYRVTYDDPGAGEVRWEIPLVALSDYEIAAISDLFTQARGRLRTFTFLDPAANLMSWSEDFSPPDWTIGPGLMHTPQEADAWNTQRATRFVCAAQAPQSATQTLEVPASFVYCLSAYARSEGGASITLVAGSQRETFALDSTWRRMVWSGVPGGSGTSVAFGLEFPPGSMVEVCGVQLEAQVAPSGYMVTRGAGGVYPAARFDHDELPITAQSFGLTDATINLVSPEVEP